MKAIRLLSSARARSVMGEISAWELFSLQTGSRLPLNALRALSPLVFTRLAVACSHGLAWHGTAKHDTSLSPVPHSEEPMNESSQHLK